MQHKIPAVFMRGGTSRAVFFKQAAMQPFDDATRDAIILTALGSPDPYGRQIDGLGGGISSLSKAAIIGSCDGPEADVTFNFAQVDVHRPFVDWSGTCGNMSAAVGPFAVDEGLVRPVEPVTRVWVLATNTGKRFIAHVPVQDGRAAVEGDAIVDGVPGTGAGIALEYLEPGGTLGGDLLPTGQPRQQISLSNGSDISVSLVDAALPMVYVRAEELGADATLLAPQLDADTALQAILEEIRCRAAVLFGLADSAEQATETVKAVPKVALVAPPADYASSAGKPIAADGIDVVARAVSMRNTHRTFPGTASMCTAVAAAVEGTVVHEVARPERPSPPALSHGGRGSLRLGHPAGIMDIAARVQQKDGVWQVDSVTTQRTARRIMEGAILVPPSALAGEPWFRAG